MKENVLRKNINSEMGSFWNELSEYGVFNLKKLNELTEYVFHLDKSNMSTFDRAQKATQLWEFTFHIQNLLISHFDPKDVFTIKLENENDINSLRQMIFYMCNWFTYNKGIEEEYLNLTKWG